MGTVWIGEHTLLGRRAAIKVLLPEYSTREEIVQRFFNEARAVTAISDPGIVQVFDFGHALGSAYIVMELLDGEAMDARLGRIGRFGPADAIRLMAQVATSLGAAHARGVIHRDLKPENIFIVGDPAVTGGERTKILDFGIAKLAADETSGVKTRTGMMMGTPVYMSPEQCRGASTIDSRSDIYALGCVLFTMVCGRPPFESDATGDLIIMHVRDAAPAASSFVPELPPELDAFLARCLEKDPARRFQTTADFVHGLAAVEAALFATSGTPRGQTGAAAALAYRQKPTPAPPDAHTRVATGQVLLPAPTTTLSSANGAAAVTAAPPRRKGALVAGLVIGLLAIGGGAFALFARGNKGPDTAAAGSGSPATAASAPAAAATATPTTTVAVPEAPPVVDAAAPVLDAGASAVATDHVDAAVASSHHTTVVEHKHKPSKVGNKQGSNASSSSSQNMFDRGD